MNNYTITGRMGQGAHGYVLKGKHKETGRIVAMKKVLIKSLDEGIPKNIMREINALRILKSPYIVELHEVFAHGMGLVLIMECLPLSLYDLLHDIDYKINEHEIKRYMQMLILGLKYMHEHHIMHRDLKPSNLLISEEGVLKIADLGLARIYAQNEPKRQYSHQVATRWYRAPELLYGSRNYTPAVDMWAVGCILVEMINKCPLFQGETDIEQLAIVLHTLGTPTYENWPDHKSLPDYNKITFAQSTGVKWETILPDVDSNTLDLVKSLVQYNHKKRPTPANVLKHKYFFTPPEMAEIDKMPKPKDLKRIPAPDFEKFDELLSEINALGF